jgi:DNA mismatch repair protein MutS
MSVSVLFRDPETSVPADVGAPAHFRDLNLDQLVADLASSREEYALEPFLFLSLSSPEDVLYRQAVFADLESARLRAATEAFAERMRDVRDVLAQARAMRAQLQRARLFASAAAMYCEAVESLRDDLAVASPASDGLTNVSAYLTSLVAGDNHITLHRDATHIEEALTAITYTIHLRGSRVRVSSFGGEADYSEAVRATFRKFEQADAPGRRSRFRELPEVDHVEGGILERVGQAFPDAFGALTAFFSDRQGFIDATVARFDREIQFYLAYLDYGDPLRSAGLSFCYPGVSARPGEAAASGAFDLVLASKLTDDGQRVVCNDLALAEDERILVVTGPNQGGKTTYARMIGQLYYLASLGCPVPGTAATVPLPDRILTHFERQEDIETLSGKLQDDLTRIRQILGQATARSLIILNEIFTSTTLADALALSERILEHVTATDCRCVCVTFLDELASFNDATVSMVASVTDGDPASRSFRLVRRRADGLAYAEAVADRYGLTYKQVRERVGS